MMTKTAFVFAALLIARAAQAAPLKDGWQLQSSCQGSLTGEQISSPHFAPEGWHKTAVPSTVLAALVADKTYPDPYVGMNLRTSVPGMDYPLGENFSNLPMASTSPFACSWWYRKEFSLARVKGRRQWLRLDGINYRANLWLNGHMIADSHALAGAWRRYELDVTTAAVPGRNVVAIEVFAPQENDLGITWVDWAPGPADKDMGLFGPVSVEETGPVAIQRPVVLSEVSQDLSSAKLTVEAALVNHSDKSVPGSLSASFDKRVLSEQVTLAPGESRVVRLTPDRFPQLRLSKPRLWWPYQMGKPNLYSMRLAFKTGASLSDSKSLPFGVRRVETEETPDSKAVLFKINGRRILIRGGGWASDLLLRQSKKRLQDELAYVEQLNLNAVRLEGKLETDDFFDEADRRGILVMPGWCCCDAWERWKDWKDEQYTVSAASLDDQIARLRAHPSVFVWLNGSDNAPPKEVEQAYLDVLKRLSWPNPVLPSASDQGGIAGHSGVKMEGPYDYVPPDYWLEDAKHGGAFGFATEVSPGPAIPALESLKRFLGADHLWPQDAVWTYHAGGTSFAQTKNFDNALERRYGKPKDLADYVRKAQAAAYEGQRAMFEAFARNKYTATGVIQWMLNNAWPSTIWHLYDYFLVPGGGFFGTRAACEPVHAQYSYDDRSVVVVSNLAKPLRDVRVEAKVFDMNAKERYAMAKDLDLPADASTRAFVIPQLSGLTTSYFLHLSLVDTDGKPLSDNTYWLSTIPDTLDFDKSTWFLTPQSSYADFTGLQSLPPAKLGVSSSLRLKNGRPQAKIVLRNVGRTVAFLARLRLTRRSDGQEIAPTFWSDNYVTLLPGESRTVTASWDRQDAEGGTPALSLDGWNLAPGTFGLAR